MTFKDVIKDLRPATRPFNGLTSFEPPSEDCTLEDARTRLEEAEALMRGCQDDNWQYMTEAGYAAYWTCIVNILLAAEKVGKESLPNVEVPDISKWARLDFSIEQLDFFGREVLYRAQSQLLDAG